jgi:hypothetical protein
MGKYIFSSIDGVQVTIRNDGNRHRIVITTGAVGRVITKEKVIHGTRIDAEAEAYAMVSRVTGQTYRLSSGAE